MMRRRSRSNPDLQSIKDFRKFREAMKQLQEDLPVTIKEENNNVEPFHTDDEHLKPMYAVVNLIVGQQQAYVDFVHGDTDADR
tara:strand:+ start:78 stop:326 length:249 start_codon:yes stop_codon:yes gene_type:complete